MALPGNFKDLRRPHFESLLALPTSAGVSEYQPPVALSEDVGEVI